MDGAREILEEMQREVTCAICRSYFSQTVTMDCGHSFCRACISSSWRAGATGVRCPECRQVSQGTKLPGVNNDLAQVTDLTKQLSSQLLQSTEGHSHCATHKEVFKLFCEDDQIPLCVRCCQSPEHVVHKLSPIEDAAHICKETFQHIGCQLGKCSEVTEKLLVEGNRSVVDWHSIIREEYFKLGCFLFEEEHRCLAKVMEEQRARQNRLSQHMKTLQDLILDVQKAGHQPNVDLLQGVKQLLGKTEFTLNQSAKPVISKLKEYPISGMIEILRQFRVDIKMDYKTASPYVTFSEDQKSVKAGESWQVDTENPDETDCYFVFAEQSFNSGRYYWEVDVTQLPQWILGIHTPPWRRMSDSTMETFESLFLLRCVKKKNYYFQTYPTSLSHQVKDTVARVGVYVEYISGTLAFYNVLQHSLIYRFDNICFTGPITPIFSPGPPLPGTKAGFLTLCPVDSHLCACCYSSL